MNDTAFHRNVKQLEKGADVGNVKTVNKMTCVDHNTQDDASLAEERAKVEAYRAAAPNKAKYPDEVAPNKAKYPDEVAPNKAKHPVKAAPNPADFESSAEWAPEIYLAAGDAAEVVGGAGRAA